ncbi:MAG: hypothetical protein LBK76_07620 [Verrucomicrobiales bacterium]|jgi:lipopolysaccharide export system protein LptA|nr:hypothetical protein [Verrucomicrobiales bacterium]
MISTNPINQWRKATVSAVLAGLLAALTAPAQTAPSAPGGTDRGGVKSPDETATANNNSAPSLRLSGTKEASSGAMRETVVDSDTFRLDLSRHSGVFVGNVHVVDPGFEMTADEMTLFFDQDNKIERMVARGNINFQQGDRQRATSREAEYLVADKKLKLTGNPIVQQGDNQVTGEVIYLYPGTDRMDVEGRSKVRFYSNE